MKHAHETKHSNHSASAHASTAKGAAAGLAEKNAPISKRYPNLYRHLHNLLEDAYDIKPTSIIESAQFAEMGITADGFNEIKSNIEMTIGKTLPKLNANVSIASLMESVIARTGHKDID